MKISFDLNHFKLGLKTMLNISGLQLFETLKKALMIKESCFLFAKRRNLQWNKRIYELFAL